jgi:hypothetical protein
MGVDEADVPAFLAEHRVVPLGVVRHRCAAYVTAEGPRHTDQGRRVSRFIAARNGRALTA